MILLTESDHGTEMNLHKALRKPIFIKKNFKCFCLVGFSGIV